MNALIVSLALPRSWKSRKIGLAVVATLGVCLLFAAEWSSSQPQLAATPSYEKDVWDCIACHAFAPRTSHPTGIPVGSIQTSLPLDAERVTCLTCHDSTRIPGHNTRKPGSDALLRESGSANLCANCHTDTTTGSAGVHALQESFAHLPQSSAARRRGSSFELDEETRACLACHDGLAAGDAGRHAVSTSMAFLGTDSLGDHPIGVEYRSSRATAHRDAIQLNDISSLDYRVRLADGMVGCGSCHSVYSKHPKHLVIPNRKSQLCLSCHTL